LKILNLYIDSSLENELEVENNQQSIPTIPLMKVISAKQSVEAG
ncbi:4495_t:CDS:1, partial [Racocetra fulgida]